MAEVQHISPPELVDTTGRYTHVVKAGNLVFIAGQTSADREGNVVGKADFPAQARQVYANLRAAVQAAGGRMEDVVKLTTYLTDPRYIPDLRAARGELWSTDPPANTLLIVSGLANPDYLLEIEAVLVVDG